MRRTRTAILACLLAVPACTDHEPATQPPTTATTTRPTQTRPAEPAPPELPALAQQRTTAGAKAFVTYYIDVLNYGVTQADSAPMARWSHETCVVCRKLVRLVNGYAKHGGRQVGGEWTPISLVVVPLTPMSAPVVTTGIDVARGYFRESVDDHKHRIEAKRRIYEFWLIWRQGNWWTADIRDTQ